jgi:hypothetical protein
MALTLGNGVHIFTLDETIGELILSQPNVKKKAKEVAAAETAEQEAKRNAQDIAKVAAEDDRLVVKMENDKKPVETMVEAIVAAEKDAKSDATASSMKMTAKKVSMQSSRWATNQRHPPPRKPIITKRLWAQRRKSLPPSKKPGKRRKT